VLLFLFLLTLVLPVTRAQDDATSSSTYCEEQGGTVVTRYPAMNTNNADDIVPFAGRVAFCEWHDVEESGIASLPVEVLYAELPTLAAIAYLDPPPFEQSGNPSANPSYTYCDQLGGAINFGAVNASGSGWVNEDAPTDVIAVCVFADGSMMESFTLFYKSDGTIRGADLTERLRWNLKVGF
jgi:putative hemolysin